MNFQVLLDPFQYDRNARDQESQIAARTMRSSLDLFNMQQAMEQLRNRRAMLQEFAQANQQSPSGPTATPAAVPGQQPPPMPTSASDMILGEIGQIDKRIAAAVRWNQIDEQDKLYKLREQAMGRYSIAKDREEQGQQRIERQRKEAVAAVGRFASGANAVLADDSITPEDKRVALQDLESSIRDENPQAYKVLAAGQPTINWGDPRTWNRMKALEQQAIDPAKRIEMKIAQQRADEQAQRDRIYEKRVDAMIAASRERGDKDDSFGKLPPGKRWIDPKDKAQGIEDIPDRSKGGANIPSDVHGQEYLDALPDTDRELVRGIAEGRIDPRTLSTKGGHREEVLKKVAQYSPGWNQAKFGVYQAVQKDFTSGVAARNVTAINTAIAHIGTMKDMADALQNHDTQKLNAIVNSVKNQFGNPNVNNFEIAASAVSNELMRVFRQVGASEAETKDWAAKFSKVQSPEQLNQGIKTAAELLRGRIDAVDDQWKRGMDSKEGYPNLLSPKSRSVMQRIGAKLPADQKAAPGKNGVMTLDEYVNAMEGK